MKTAAIAVALTAVAADIYLYRTLRSRAARCLFAIWSVATNLTMWTALVLLRTLDTDTATIHAAMWIVFGYIVTVLPRTIFALFRIVSRGRRPVIAAGALLSAAFVALCIWGATAGRRNIRVERIAICCEDLPQAFDGMRIVQFSDVHIGSLTSPRRSLQALVDTVNSLHGDLVVHSGDLVNIRCEELDAPTLELLGRITAREGVYSTLGNHDLGFYIKDTVSLPPAANVRRVIEAQESIGWHVLVDSSAILRRGGDSISITGLNFPAALRMNSHNSVMAGVDLDTAYAGLPDSIFNITVSHAPQMWCEILAAGRGDLTLAGHVHSMQMKLRLFGREFSPAQIAYREWSGLYRHDGRYLYINDGIGYVGFPMRLGAYPEVTVIELRRCE